jgi:Tol biopolymer transport system component
LGRLLAALAASCAAAEEPGRTAAPGPEAVLRSLIEAMNRHDVDAQYAHYTNDMVYVHDGLRIVPSREDGRGNREFEGAGGASWSYELVSSGADRLTAVFTERLDLYDALGAGPRSSLRELLFRDGKIASMSATEWTQRGRPYQGARDLFRDWLLRERKQDAARLVRDGQLVFDASTARPLAALAREWRAAHPCRLYHPSFDRAGERVVFSSDCDGRWNVYVARADGTHPRRLTDNRADARRPAWSPDGRTVFFHSDRDADEERSGRDQAASATANWEIYSVGADGAGLRRLSDHPAADRNAVPSPDGRTILWTSERDGSPELFLMPAAGGSPRRLTAGTTRAFAPVWSPDGRTILHAATRKAEAKDGDPITVYRIGFDGAPLGELPGGPRREYNHAFSPDGRTIAFDAHESGGWESDDGGWELWLMAADGSNRRRLTRNQVNDWGPSFSPDGGRLVFLSGMENVYDLYTIGVDGTGRRRLTYWTEATDR